VFDDDAVTSIVDGVAPFTGSFSPEQALSDLNGKNAVGTWILHIDDTYPDVSDGTLNEWAITFE